MKIDELGTILSIWAHPDDESYLSAGIMAAARENGQRVVCVTATAGEHGTSDPAIWPPERLGQVRRWEATAAMAVLGVAEHSVCGLPDGGLVDNEEAGLAWVRGLFAEIRPDTVLTFDADGQTYHPDHIAVCRWVTQVWRENSCSATLLYSVPTKEELAKYGAMYEEWQMYMSDERPAGIPLADTSLHVKLDGRLLDRKVAALRAMATQTADVVAAVGDDVYREMVSTEAFLAATR